LANSRCTTISKKRDILNSSGTGSTLIFPEADQQFTESLLARTTATTRGALARHIHQLGDALPAGTTGRGILAVGHELLGLGAGLRSGLVGLVVVGNVEVVDVLVGLLGGRFFLLVRDLCAAGNFGVALLTPFSMWLKCEVSD
jgi:hypothetical protein